MTASLDVREVSSFLARAVDIGAERLDERPFEDLAEHWRALGLRPGDLVLLSLPTGVALLQHFFAVLAAGGVPALLAPGAPSARLAEMAARLSARAVGAVRLPSGLSAERVAPLGLLEVAWFPASAPPAASPGEVVLLTSGTSGFASGCVTSLEAMLRNGARHADAVGQREGDAVIVHLPLHFSFALVAQAMATLGRGGRLLIAGPPFLPDAYLEAISTHGADVSALSPTQARALLQRDAAPAGLRVLSVGGDALAPAHVAGLLRRRPGAELYLTYGLTQAGPRVSTLAAHAEPERRFASVGLPLASTAVHLEDLDDGTGRRELIVSSDTVMRRRIGLVEGRARDDLRAPGVLATGDVFERDDDGYLTYRGRLSEHILRGGEKISVAAVRRVATGLPGVLTARTRVLRNEAGEDYDLILLVTAEAPDSPERMRAQLARSLRRAELPRAIELVPEHQAHALGFK
jgi:acyl-CoA synthetase (AMP-forming)/AMP-acid ligase II